MTKSSLKLGLSRFLFILFYIELALCLLGIIFHFFLSSDLWHERVLSLFLEVTVLVVDMAFMTAAISLWRFESYVWAVFCGGMFIMIKMLVFMAIIVFVGEVREAFM